VAQGQHNGSSGLASVAGAAVFGLSLHPGAAGLSGELEQIAKANRKEGYRREERAAAPKGRALVRKVFLTVCILAAFSSHAVERARQSGASAPVVVQPGAPGQPTKTLPPSTKGALPPLARADVEFMQGMIMHHAQAVEMTALIASHTENKELHTLGARISNSQIGEINFMKRWLVARGQPISMAMPGMPEMDMNGKPMALMPGMLSAEQMVALRKAEDAEFDRLFLTGMIQHHEGALTMVKDLFNTAGAGQDAEIFDFATDADNSQRAEIKIMQGMLERKTAEEKQ
jgi:uncharacterized protein (DUF305 family)